MRNRTAIIAAGSGTTIIACEQTGRACVAIEVSPQYVDVAIRRWQSFVGAEAIHEPTGRPFAAIAAACPRILDPGERAP